MLLKSPYREVNNWLELKCGKELQKILESESDMDRRFPIQDKFSVILSTFDRMEVLLKLISHYKTSKLVDHIFVIWHNDRVEPPEVLQLIAKKKKRPKVTILKQDIDSLNNKFNPVSQLRTQAVLIADDDVLVSVPDMEFTFQMWKVHPHSLVGNFLGFHKFKPSHNPAWQYREVLPGVTKKDKKYSIILDKFMFMRSEYLFWYTCILPESVHAVGKSCFL